AGHRLGHGFRSSAKRIVARRIEIRWRLSMVGVRRVGLALTLAAIAWLAIALAMTAAASATAATTPTAAVGIVFVATGLRLFRTTGFAVLIHVVGNFGFCFRRGAFGHHVVTMHDRLIAHAGDFAGRAIAILGPASATATAATPTAVSVLPAIGAAIFAGTFTALFGARLGGLAFGRNLFVAVLDLVADRLFGVVTGAVHVQRHGRLLVDRPGADALQLVMRRDQRLVAVDEH